MIPERIRRAACTVVLRWAAFTPPGPPPGPAGVFDSSWPWSSVGPPSQASVPGYHHLCPGLRRLLNWAVRMRTRLTVPHTQRIHVETRRLQNSRHLAKNWLDFRPDELPSDSRIRAAGRHGGHDGPGPCPARVAVSGQRLRLDASANLWRRPRSRPLHSSPP